MLVWFNAHDDAVEFTVPTAEHSPAWDLIVDTTGTLPTDEPVVADAVIEVPARSLVVLRAHLPEPDEPDTSVAASVAASVASSSDDVRGTATRDEANPV
jgi:glycogen operon protein